MLNLFVTIAVRVVEEDAAPVVEEFSGHQELIIEARAASGFIES